MRGLRCKLGLLAFSWIFLGGRSCEYTFGQLMSLGITLILFFLKSFFFVCLGGVKAHLGGMQHFRVVVSFFGGEFLTQKIKSWGKIGSQFDAFLLDWFC